MRTLVYLEVDHFTNLYKRIPIKPTSISDKDIARTVAMEKFDRCYSAVFNRATILPHVHGVNVFALPELKERREVIT